MLAFNALRSSWARMREAAERRNNGRRVDAVPIFRPVVAIVGRMMEKPHMHVGMALEDVLNGERRLQSDPGRARPSGLAR